MSDATQVMRDAWEALNSRDMDRYGRLLDEECVWESDTLPQRVHGREAVGQMMQMYFKAFPDLRFDIQHTIASGDTVVTRWTATGTHQGELMGIPATNRWAETHGCSVTEVRGGKLAQSWIYWDTGHLLRQLGVFPMQQPKAA